MSRQLGAALVQAVRPALTAGVRGSLSGSLPVVAGLDISTRAIGIAVAAPNGMLLHSEVLTASANEAPFHVAAAVGERLAQAHQSYGGIGHVGVEDYLRGFQRGFGHASGMFKLSAINAMICFEAWNKTGAGVGMYSAASIRAYFGVSKPRKETAVGGAPKAGTTAAVKRGRKNRAAVPPVNDVQQHDDDEGTALETGSSSVSQSLPRDEGEDEHTAALLQDVNDVAREEPLQLPAAVPKNIDATKVAVWRYVSQMNPALEDTWTFGRTGLLQATNFDRADAVLTCMYATAQQMRHVALFSLPSTLPSILSEVSSHMCTVYDQAAKRAASKHDGGSGACATTAARPTREQLVAWCNALLRADEYERLRKQCANLDAWMEVGGHEGLELDDVDALEKKQLRAAHADMAAAGVSVDLVTATAATVSKYLNAALHAHMIPQSGHAYRAADVLPLWKPALKVAAAHGGA